MKSRLFNIWNFNPWHEFQHREDEDRIARQILHRAMRQQLISGVTLPAAWNQYNTQDPNGFELAHSQLWFTRTYTSAVTTVLNFFDQPLATADLFTNVFPYQNSVLVKAIGVFFKVNVRDETLVGPAATQTGIFNDIVSLVNTGLLTFNITKKDYGPFALWKLASGGGVWAYNSSPNNTPATAGVLQYAQLGAPSVEAAFRLSIPFVIPAQTMATIKMAWPAGAVTLQAGNPAMCLCLETIEARPKQ
jgi:hypothetical protein